MYTRFYEDKDKDQIFDLVRSHEKMHGVDITRFRDKFAESLVDTSNPNRGTICVFSNTDDLLGTVKVSWSENLPIWLVDFAFSRQLMGTNSNRVPIEITSFGFDFAVEQAEKRNKFDFYYAVRDKTGGRLQNVIKFNPKIQERYEITDVEVLEPGKISQYASFNYMRAILQQPNRKTVVIKQAHLKPEFRPNPWSK
jgi:hypothetical protein